MRHNLCWRSAAGTTGLLPVLVLALLIGCDSYQPTETPAELSETTPEGSEALRASANLDAHAPNNLHVWGDDSFHQVSGVPLGTFRALAQGGSINGLVLRIDGTPVFWGFSANAGPDSLPAALKVQKFQVAALGRDDGVLIRRDGTLAAFGKRASIAAVPAGSYRAVAVGAFHAVAVSEKGTLTTWGDDPFFQGLLNAPRGGRFTAVALRNVYSLALSAGGTLYFWGPPPTGDDFNFLDGWTPTREDPNIYFIPGETFTTMAAGNVHALAIRRNGTITGWGDSRDGALSPPTHVRFTAVAAGFGFSIGLDADGMLWGWGKPRELSLPGSGSPWTFAEQGWAQHGNSEHYFVPDMRFREIAAGASHILALTPDR